MQRRDFLAGAGVTALGGMIPDVAQAAVGGRGKVLEVTDPRVTVGPKELDAPTAARLLDRTLMAFTGEPEPVRAMGHFVRQVDTVGIKLNCLGAPHMAFNKEYADRLVELLLEFGIPPERILVYDQYRSRMYRAGYRHTDVAGEVRVLHHKMPGWEYDKRVQRYDDKRSFRWSSILLRCSAIFNCCVAKDHDRVGVTGALKNMAFGNIDAPWLFHAIIHDAVVTLYSQNEVRRRVRLNLCDASRVLYHGGSQDNPLYRARHDGLLVSTDPVAMDWAILELVNRYRDRYGLEPVESVQRPRPRPPVYLANAAANGLGARLHQVRWSRVGPGGRKFGVAIRHVGEIEPGEVPKRRRR